MNDAYIRIYRDAGRITRCEVVEPPSAERIRGGYGERVIELHTNALALDPDAMALAGGTVSITVFANRVRFLDQA